MNDRVRIEIDSCGVADVCMVRGDKMNALDAAMFEALAAAIDRLKTEAGLRVVLLHGEGKAFCAGLDMGRFEKMGDGQDAALSRLGPRTHGISNAPQYVAWGWRELPVPVIAAVHGVAFGGGLQVALGGDVRLVTPDTKMSVMEIKWGLVPDMAGMVLMRSLLRDDVARELTYSGRVVLGEEAVRIGLATRACADPLAQAREMAQAMAQRSPSAIRTAKQLFNQASGLTDAGAAALLQAESNAQAALIGAPHQREAVRANLERRNPSFGPAA